MNVRLDLRSQQAIFPLTYTGQVFVHVYTHMLKDSEGREDLQHNFHPYSHKSTDHSQSSIIRND